LEAKTVDLVITDPPFFDNVHYSELADFFFAWQQREPSPFTQGRASTRHPEEVQDVSVEQFAAKLGAVFSESCRVLKDDGLIVFSYHHSRAEGWTSLANAILEAGLSFVNCHPIKAEMSVAAPKSQAKEPIQLDVLLVCRKRPADKRDKQSVDAATERAVAYAKAKAARLQGCGLTLSVNDRRVILIGQFLIEACAGRSAAQLSDVLSEKLTDLDLVALRLLEFPEDQKLGHRAARTDDRQLTLLE
jgi:putative DNA methylase